MEKAITSQRGQVLRDLLRRERVRQRITMRVLAKRLDVPFQFVSKVERGERRLDVPEFVEYCEALGIDPIQGLKIVVRG